MALTVGVDIGGTKIAAGVVDEGGAVVAEDRRSTPSRDVDAGVAVIVDLVRDLTAGLDVEAVGLGCAGLVDADRSTVLVAPNLGWTGVPLRAAVQEGTGLPAVVENDANAAAWGEHRFGAGRGHRDVVMVTVGTGIGGGLVLDGRMWRGRHGVAAEVGHINAVPGGRLCACGRHGCWEQYASGNALVREARAAAADRRGEAALLLSLGDGTPEGVGGQHVTEAARAGDPVARDVFTTVGQWLGRGLADLAALLDPSAFVVGGGVSEAGDLLLEPLRATLEDNLVGRAQRRPPDVVLAQLGNGAGLVGAADLARDR